MQNSPKRSAGRRNIGQSSIIVLTISAMLIAMSIVCGKYLSIKIGNVIRLSFENLPIIFAGVLFGPVGGVAVGVIADLLGCFMYGYEINPVVTAGAAVIALVSGAAWKFLRGVPYWLRLFLTVAPAHLLGSVVVKTIGLASWYTMPLWELMLWRLLTYVLIGVAEYFILYAVIKSKALRAALPEFMPGEDSLGGTEPEKRERNKKEKTK